VTYFVLVYNRRLGQLVERQDYPGDARATAWGERDRLSLVHANLPDVEVVLLGSDSEETLRATHGRYFRRSDAARQAG
jgi:hypothetical protein